MTSPEFYVFLPQMRMTTEAMVERAQAAEAAGFTGIALMDHLAPPMAEDQPMHDAMVTAGWLLAHTTTLRVGHLVLCDAFRHPVVLARQAVSLDHASGGRFDLGLGWGSVPAELETYGVMTTDAPTRVERMAETLDVLELLWSGERVDYDGEHHRLEQAVCQPTPLGSIPIVIGGAGPKTMQLVAQHADWWNCPVHRLDRFESIRERAGSARASIQEMVAFVPEESRRDEIVEAAERRFGYHGDRLVIGDAAEVGEHYAARAERGVERFYAWFTDFASPETLRAFGDQVIGVS